MKKIFYILLLLTTLTSCAKRNIPQKITIVNNCDSLIEETLKKIQKQPQNINCKDSSYINFCNDLQLTNITLASKVSKLSLEILVKQKVIDSLILAKPSVYIDKSKTKTKNSNNNTDVTKLKNSFLISKSQLDSITFENISLKGKIKLLEKEVTKNKNSTTGDSSPNVRDAGNTTKKAEWYVWLIVFLAGGITSLGTRAIITKTI